LAPLGNNNRSIFIWGFLKDDILACVETWHAMGMHNANCNAYDALTLMKPHQKPPKKKKKKKKKTTKKQRNTQKKKKK